MTRREQQVTQIDQTNTLLLNEFLGESNRLLFPSLLLVKEKKGKGCFSEKSKDTSHLNKDYSIENY